MMPVKEASQWFDEIAPKNPLIGSRAGENTNSIMVQIGRRLTVEEILEAAMTERLERKPKPFSAMASELMGKITQ